MPVPVRYVVPTARLTEYVPVPTGCVGLLQGAGRDRDAVADVVVEHALGVGESLLGDLEGLPLLVGDVGGALVRRAGEQDTRGRDREDGHHRERHHERDAAFIADEPLRDPANHAQAPEVAAFRSVMMVVPVAADPAVVPAFEVRAA